MNSVVSNVFNIADIEPPTLDSCPSGPILEELSPGSPPQAQIYFEEPQASDNSQQALQVVTTPPGVSSPIFVSTDTLITYEFIDEAGNRATCSFLVAVISNYVFVVFKKNEYEYENHDDSYYHIPAFIKIPYQMEIY